MSIVKDLIDVAYESNAVHSSDYCQKIVIKAEEFMARIKNAVTTDKNVLRIEIPERDWSPPDAATFVAELKLSGPHIVLISGRGPVWLYGMLVHAAHATKAVATMDPRLGGYVVVETHCGEYSTGQIITE